MTYASFTSRFLAKAVDQIILAAASVAFMSLWHQDEQLFAKMYILQWLFNVAYSAAFLARFQATPGKMLIGMKVVRSNGSKLTEMRALGRSLAELLSYFPVYLGYIIAAFDGQRRTLHDRIADTRVVMK